MFRRGAPRVGGARGFAGRPILNWADVRVAEDVTNRDSAAYWRRPTATRDGASPETVPRRRREPSKPRATTLSAHSPTRGPRMSIRTLRYLVLPVVFAAASCAPSDTTTGTGTAGSTGSPGAAGSSG